MSPMASSCNCCCRLDFSTLSAIYRTKSAADAPKFGKSLSPFASLLKNEAMMCCVVVVDVGDVKFDVAEATTARGRNMRKNQYLYNYFYI